MAGVTATAGNAFTVTVTVAVVVAEQLSETVTVYVPVAAGVAAVMVGFCDVDVKLFGPAHA